MRNICQGNITVEKLKEKHTLKETENETDLWSQFHKECVRNKISNHNTNTNKILQLKRNALDGDDAKFMKVKTNNTENKHKMEMQSVRGDMIKKYKQFKVQWWTNQKWTDTSTDDVKPKELQGI